VKNTTKLAYHTEDGKLVKLNTYDDECLWSGRWQNEREQNRFDELYVHVTRGGKRIFYIAYVTYWQGESNEITVLEDPQKWVEDNYHRLSSKQIARLEELEIKVEETA